MTRRSSVCLSACLHSATLRALEELFDRPIEIYSSEGEDLRPMKIDFDASGVSTLFRPACWLEKVEGHVAGRGGATGG